MNYAFGSEDLLLRQAVDEYQRAMEEEDINARLGRFSRAEQLFRQVIETLHASGRSASPELHVSLGNAALQARNMGIAILAFRRALAVDPDHEQALQNLAYARGMLPEWARSEESSQLIETLFFWKRMYSRSQILLFAAISFLLGALLVALSVVTRRSLWRNLAALPLILWLVLLSSSWFSETAISRDAVVVQDETILYSADSENASPRLAQPLPDGTELTLLQQRERWTEVRFSGRSGWVRSSAIESVHQS